jgi:hypothetical protein
MSPVYAETNGSASHEATEHQYIEDEVAKPLSSLDGEIRTFFGLLCRGFWPVAIYPRGTKKPGDGKIASGKEPIGARWGAEQWTMERANSVFGRYAKVGVGICLGPGRGPGGKWLMDVEGDGPEAEASRAKLFGGEIVVTMGHRSARGGHQFLCGDGDRLTPIVARFKPFQVKDAAAQPGVFKIPGYPGLEFRLGGYTSKGAVKQLQSVVPPTIGTDGKSREWNGVETIADAPESFYASLQTVADQVEAQARSNGKHKARKPDPPFTTTVRTEEGRLERYALAGLIEAAAKIAGTAEGNRHNVARDEALNIAGLVKAGVLSEGQYRDALTEAGRACGLPDDEIAELLASALEMATARDLTRAREWKPVGCNGQHETNGEASGPDYEKEAEEFYADRKPKDGRVRVELSANFHETVDQSAALLIKHHDVYVRDRALVVVNRKDASDPTAMVGVKRHAGSPQIAVLNTVTARTRISRLATFWSFDRREDDWVQKAPPKDVAEAVVGLGEYPDARELLMIVESPTIRPDGSLLVTPGYDRATGLLYMPNATFPEIPDAPTLAEVQRAALALLYLAHDFPFKSDTDRAAWLALVLTLIARGAIEGPCPGFLFSANVAGSGKSNLVAAAAKIATGRPPAYDGYASDDIEMEKRLGAVAMTVDPLLLLDNAPNGSAVGCPSLDRAIMADGTFRARILGRSELTPSVTWRTVVAITGNNLSTKDDALRRFVPSFLLSPIERPETRDPAAFRVTQDTGLSLNGYIERERPKLVVAALTILRGYVTAGRPKGVMENGKRLPPMDFEAWDAVVRQSVYYALGIDPCGSRAALQANDETTLDRHRIVEAWRDLCLIMECEDSGITARQATDHLNADAEARFNRDPSVVRIEDERLKPIRDAFAKAMQPRSIMVDSNKLGYILRRHRDAVTDYGSLEDAGKSHHAVLWKVKTP